MQGGGLTTRSCLAWSLCQSLCRFKHIIQHLFSQSAGERILLADMVAAEHPTPFGHLHFRAVSKFRSRRWCNHPVALNRMLQRCAPRQPAQRQKHLRLVKLDRTIEKRRAGLHFFGLGLIIGRSTATNVRDRAANQFSSVETISRDRLVG